jgi:hypothetical protein|tara:strand:- start:1643 stop:2881 length:1239 start_codon:yes stop_codon:yes gene_type:complete
MMDQIKCPNCAQEFDVEQALAGKLEVKYKADYEKKVSEQASKFNAERNVLAKEMEAFELKKEKENELFKERLAKQIEKEREVIQKSTQENFEQQLKALADENEKKKEENRHLRAAEINLLKRENDLKEKAEELQLEVDKKMLEKQTEIEEKGRAKEREINMLREKEFQKKLEDQKKLIDEMKRKAEQGSMQMQGEIQELALEELLRTSYPFDNIAEVGKGIRGADCIQTVVNSLQQTCGSIIYESKRTKNFAGDWIDKLKQDQVNAKADLAVLVTETMPNDMDKFGQKDGVWICGFNEAKSLSLVLREMLMKTHSVKSSEDNKGGKMEMLYSYLNGNEFIQTITRILEVYTNMESDLNTEKRAMTKIWKTREKQIEVVALNISSMFGSIKGIAGNDLASSSILELPDSPKSE